MKAVNLSVASLLFSHKISCYSHQIDCYARALGQLTIDERPKSRQKEHPHTITQNQRLTGSLNNISGSWDINRLASATQVNWAWLTETITVDSLTTRIVYTGSRIFIVNPLRHKSNFSYP